MDKTLIVDVGMHIGKDTEFYLRKGFRVAAVEANPALVSRARERLAPYLADGRLVIHNVAIASHEGEVDFYVNDRRDDWGTISRQFAERNERLGSSSKLLRVDCTTLDQILRLTGVPYYLKIDVEGVDTLCLQQLAGVAGRPRYLSIEAGLTRFEEAFDQLSLLWQLGYREFKIVDQALNAKVRCPYPALEGEYVDCRFDGLCSGPFGEEAPGRWLGIEETIRSYRRLLTKQSYFGAHGRFHNTILHRAYELLVEPIGWYDFHAKLGDSSS